MADKFEIMKVLIPLTLNYDNDLEPEEKENLKSVNHFYVKTFTPCDDESTAAAWEKASELAKEGWELVGSIPLIGYSFSAGRITMHSVSSFPRDLSHSYTSGYELLFKRRIE